MEFQQSFWYHEAILELEFIIRWKSRKIEGDWLPDDHEAPMGFAGSTLHVAWQKNKSNYLLSVLITQSCPTLCNPVDCGLSSSSVHGILQARILEWDAISFSRGSSQPRDQTQFSRIAGRFFTIWAAREAIVMYYNYEFSYLFLARSLILTHTTYIQFLPFPQVFSRAPRKIQSLTEAFT